MATLLPYEITRYVKKPNKKTKIVLITILTIFGSLLIVRAIGANAKDVARTQVARFIVTAYNSVPEQTDSTPCIAANGQDICNLLERGDNTCAMAAPFGTRVEIPGFGTCTVRDRLSSKYKRRIDLYFGGRDKIAAARKWGKQTLRVKVTYP